MGVLAAQLTFSLSSFSDKEKGNFAQLVTWVQFYKTFYGLNLRIFVISSSVCPWQILQPTLMLVGKSKTFPSQEPFTCSALGQAPGLAHKQQTRLDRLARDKVSSLLQKLVNYDRKKLNNIVNRGQRYKTFYSCNLLIFTSVCQIGLERQSRTNTLAYYENS